MTPATGTPAVATGAPAAATRAPEAATRAPAAATGAPAAATRAPAAATGAPAAATRAPAAATRAPAAATGAPAAATRAPAAATGTPARCHGTPRTAIAAPASEILDRGQRCCIYRDVRRVLDPHREPTGNRGDSSNILASLAVDRPRAGSAAAGIELHGKRGIHAARRHGARAQPDRAAVEAGNDGVLPDGHDTPRPGRRAVAEQDRRTRFPAGRPPRDQRRARAGDHEVAAGHVLDAARARRHHDASGRVDRDAGGFVVGGAAEAPRPQLRAGPGVELRDDDVGERGHVVERVQRLAAELRGRRERADHRDAVARRGDAGHRVGAEPAEADEPRDVAGRGQPRDEAVGAVGRRDDVWRTGGAIGAQRAAERPADDAAAVASRPASALTTTHSSPSRPCSPRRRAAGGIKLAATIAPGSPWIWLPSALPRTRDAANTSVPARASGTHPRPGGSACQATAAPARASIAVCAGGGGRRHRRRCRTRRAPRTCGWRRRRCRVARSRCGRPRASGRRPAVDSGALVGSALPGSPAAKPRPSPSDSDLLAAGAQLGDHRGQPELVDPPHPARADAQRDPALLVLEPEPLVAQVDLEPPLGVAVGV